MEGQEPPLPPPPPLDSNNSSSFGDFPSLISQGMQDNLQVGAADIDWVTFFTASNPINNSNKNNNNNNNNTTANNFMHIPSNNASLTSTSVNGGHLQNANIMKGKSGKGKKYGTPRIAFHTRSTEDILGDGYKWRKYGQKSVKNCIHPRSYYRCTHHTCNVKKQIQRHSKDTGIVMTTYEGIHNHPCEQLMETLSPLLRQIQFLARF